MISEKDKKILIEKLNKSFSTVGKEIPDLLVIDGEKLELSNIILNLIKKTEITKEDLKIKSNLHKLLVKKEENNENILKNKDLTNEEAENIYEETLGIKRAILALEGVGKEKEDLKNAYRDDGVEDMKRWIDFLKKVK